jgi:general secretion pathway protein K
MMAGQARARAYPARPGSLRPQRRPAAPTRARSRGAALLLAMIIVALVSTLASGMVWQQWRAVQVESAERSRMQAVWILAGAQDWSALILREDARADRSAGRPPVDHLGEPWATPLAEARLSTFLAANREDNTDGGPEAFLSGRIVDAQSRYNLRNLIVDGKVSVQELQKLARLCEAAGVPSSVGSTIAQGLEASWRAPAPGMEPPGDATLPVQHFAHLARLGLDAATLSALRPYVDVLPKPTPVNLNTAARETLAAVLGIDVGTAERLVQARQRSPFDSLERARVLLAPEFPIEQRGVSVSSAFFEVSGRLRLDERVVEERSLVERQGDQVITQRRERVNAHTGAP